MSDLFMTIAAFAVAALVCVALGHFTIPWLVARKFKDGAPRKASDTLNEINKSKANVPTMGGLFLIAAIVAVALAMLPYDGGAHWYVLGAVVASALLGAYDDWIKLNKKCDKDGKRLDGMRSRTKFVLQVAIMAACGYGVLGTLPRESAEMLWIPSFNVGIDVGWWALPLAIFVGVGTTNAVNLSDGLDGLAAGLMAMAAAGLTAVALLMSANDSLLTNAPEHAATLAAIIAGASVGFLFYNRHPARVFMGDTGSLALGAGLGMLAVSLRQELLLVLFGAVFVAEALSVMIQVTYFRLTGGKRIFRCSPLHHHFQFMGWHETKVTRRFWAICAMFCALALAAVWFGRVDHDSPTTQQQAQNKHTPSPAVSVRR